VPLCSEGDASYWAMVTRYSTQMMMLELSHDIWFIPVWSATSALGTKGLRLIPARVVCFQIVPSIIDDSIDGYDLYLACVVEGHHFVLGVLLEHYRGVYVFLASVV